MPPARPPWATPSTAGLPSKTGHRARRSAAPRDGRGTAAGAGNLISGNAGAGVLISGPGATDNLIVGNLIGTTAAGTAALGNGGAGVSISGGAFGNTIGGAAAGAGNVISGNAGHGVQ